MKLPLSWLREWVDWPQEWDARELARRITFAGIEVETVAPAAPSFSGVLVARIAQVEPHPRADKLRVCRVTIEPTAALQIVCGAANAREGLVTPLATVGARLPEGRSIAATAIRGVESAGMLCSARELGLSDSSEGILELPEDAPLGLDLRRYLDLDDSVLDFNVTANRGDAMSVLGIAREIAALSGAPLKNPLARASHGTPDRAAAAGAQRAHTARTEARTEFTLALVPQAGAARLTGCVLHDADNTRPTPSWMRERLRRCGLRSISPVVDVTNYVMLELGQPIHAYDLNKLHGGLTARPARSQERLLLLDGRELKLEEGALVIADEQAAVGLAGIMGGKESAIEAGSRDIALEAGWFKPGAIAATARRLGIATDAGQRFERGVDWNGQERGIQRAAQLIEQLTGALAQAPLVVQREQELPRIPSVTLRAAQLQRLLGVAIDTEEVERRLRSLGMKVMCERDEHREPDAQQARDSYRQRERQSQSQEEGRHAGQGARWQVQPPAWRFDIALEVDLIEEVARLRGLDTIAGLDAPLPIVPRRLDASAVEEQVVMRTLAARGYQEIITYAFVDPALQRQLFGEQTLIELANPLASDRSVMRSSLWPGLIDVARENLRRQADRVRLFEIGTRFLLDASASGAEGGTQGAARSGYREQKMLAGIALGSRLPEQWGSARTAVDFYDVKADLTSLLALGAGAEGISFDPISTGCLYPGRSAGVMRGGQEIGVIGELHPALVQALDLTSAPIVFELDYAQALHGQAPQFEEISRFPQIRRDLSVTVPAGVAFASLAERVSVAASSLLKEIRLFDVYQGAGIESGRKSIAFGLILQDLGRTLTDEDADRVVAAVLRDLQGTLDARIRQ